MKMNTFLSRTGFVLSFLLIAFLGLNSCKKDPVSPSGTGTLKLNVEAYFEDEPYEYYTIYSNISGYRIRLDNFQFYLSNLHLIKSNGDLQSLMDIDLVNMHDGAQEYDFSVRTGNYSGISFGVGVPEELNKDQDPTQYPNSHPLSVSGSQGMYWSWNTGYIFTMVDGRVDFTGQEENELEDAFAFHCGEDLLYRTHVRNQTIEINKDEITEITIRLQVDRFFYNDDDLIDLAINSQTHTSGNLPLAERFTTLFNEAIIIE